MMMNTARVMDPTGSMMDLSVQNFFHWGVLVNNRSAIARAQYAMVFQCVRQEYDKAERFYKQAVGLDPGDARISTNYEDFVQGRYPGGAYDNHGPPIEVKRRSKLVQDLVDFERYRDDACRKETEKTYLRNKFTEECTWFEPDWEDVWNKRRYRSELESRVEEWQQYYDPLTQRSFEYNASTGEHRWKAY